MSIETQPVSPATNGPADFEEILERFDRAWQRGPRPALANYLLPITHPPRPELLIALVHIDLEYRLKAGDEAPLVETYLKLYPEELSTPETAAGLIVLEYQERRRRDARVEQEEYLRRFPHYAFELRSKLKPYRYCPHCRNSTELLADTANSLICPKCGRETPLHSGMTESTTAPTRPISLPTPRPDWPTIPGYEIHQVLGQGGMGVVYKAWQTGLQRLVALKMIQRGALARPEDLARFRQEAVAVAQLRHPNIVQIYEIGAHEARPFFSLELVEGPNLGQKLAGLPQPPDQAAQLVETLARAVQAAHERGIIHRDLKPANILLQGSGIGDQGLGNNGLATRLIPDPHSLIPNPQSLIPKIADFGLAKQIHGEGAQTLSGIIVGTPRYMAPEQAAGRTKEIGPSVDVYGLGGILYEMVVGRPPFQGPSTTETLRQVVSEEAVSPRRLQPKVPRDLETICLKCLEKEPHLRYTSAAALAEDLRRFQAGEPIVARPVGPLQRAWRWCRRNPLVAAQAAVVVFLMLAGTAISAIFIAKAGERAAEAARETKRAERGQYISDMRLAGSYWEASQAAWIMDLLDRHLPGPSREEDLRGFEWFFWDRLCHSERLTLRGHADRVWSVAFSADAKQIASSSGDKTVKIWDAASGKEIRTLRGHTDVVRCVAYSPDGKYLASASYDRKVKIWDADSGREIQILAGHTGFVESLAFSPDGRYLATGSDDQSVRVWDVGTGKKISALKGHKEPVLCVAFSPDGRRLVSGSNDAPVIIWDTVTGQQLQTLKGHSDGGNGIAFSPGGHQLVSTGGHDDRTVKISDVTTGKEIRTLRGHTAHITSVAYRPDGKILASASNDKTVKLWDPSSGRLMLTLQGHTSSVHGLAFSPDGSQLATASADGTVRIWDERSCQESLFLKGHNQEVNAVAFSPDDKYLASASDDRTVKIWDLASNQVTRTLPGHAKGVNGIAFSPEGKYFASASDDHTVNLWAAADGRLVHTFIGHTDKVWRPAFSPDGLSLASPSEDKTVKIWDVASGQEFLTVRPDADRINGVAFSPDGRRLAIAGWAYDAPVWDLTSGQRVLALKGHTDAIWSIAFSPDGDRLATASNDGTVRLWDAATGLELLTLRGHTRQVSCVVFSPDGKRLASAGWDGTVRVWEANTGQEVLTLKGDPDRIFSVAFSHNGRRLAGACRDGTVKIWDAMPRQP